MRHTPEALLAYVEALFAKFSGKGSVAVSEAGVRQHDRFLEFAGREPGMRKDARYVIPFQEKAPGVIVASAILKGRPGIPMKWLLNGQASSGCEQVAHMGAGSDEAVSLHASLGDVEAWCMAPLERRMEAGADVPEDLEEHCRKDYAFRARTGLYADGPGLGSLHDRKGSGTLVLEIEPIAVEAAPAP